jgi:Na+-driven multidrug efflux pump
VIQQTGKLDPIDIWIAILIGHATRCALSVIRFRQGKWRGIAVDLDDPLRSTPGVRSAS